MNNPKNVESFPETPQEPEQKRLQIINVAKIAVANAIPEVA